MDIYDRIKDLMIKQHKTRKQMSETLKIPYATLTAMYQRRSNNVDVRTMKKIATYLNTTLEYLVSGNEDIKMLDNKKAFSIIAIDGEMKQKTYTFDKTNFETIILIIEKVMGASNENK